MEEVIEAGPSQAGHLQVINQSTVTDLIEGATTALLDPVHTRVTNSIDLQNAVHNFNATYKTYCEGQRRSNLPLPVQLELVKYEFIANYPGCDWEDISNPPSMAIGIGSNNEGAWQCNTIHASGHFLNASSRTTCFGCGTPRDKGTAKPRRSFDIPYKTKSNDISEQGWVMFADTSEAWLARELQFKPGQGATRNPRNYNAAACELRRAMLREGITDKDALGHCRLLLQVKLSQHYQAYLASKPYLPYAIVLEIVDAVKVIEQLYNTNPSPHLVPFRNDFIIPNYSFPSNWRKGWMTSIQSKIEGVLISNYGSMGNLCWEEGHLAFAVFLMISTLGNDVWQVIDHLAVEGRIRAQFHFFAISRAILEMGDIESGFLRMLAYCTYVRVETKVGWKGLDVAWGIEAEEIEEIEEIEDVEVTD